MSLIKNIINAAQFADHIVPSIRGVIAGRAEAKVVKARFQYLLRRNYTTLTTRDGYTLRDPIEIVSWWEHVVEGGLFREWPHDVASVLDIGANHGIFGWAVKQRFPPVRLFGFEPADRERGLIKQLGVYEDISGYALGAENGEVTLYDATVGTYTIQPVDGWTVKSAQKVQVRKLDEVSKLPAYTVVKIDVDGGEINVVRGGQSVLRASDLVIIEITRPQDVAPIAQLLDREPVRITRLDYVFRRKQEA